MASIYEFVDSQYNTYLITINHAIKINVSISRYIHKIKTHTNLFNVFLKSNGWASEKNMPKVDWTIKNIFLE